MKFSEEILKCGSKRTAVAVCYRIFHWDGLSKVSCSFYMGGTFDPTPTVVITSEDLIPNERIWDEALRSRKLHQISLIGDYPGGTLNLLFLKGESGGPQLDADFMDQDLIGEKEHTKVLQHLRHYVLEEMNADKKGS